MSENRRRIFWLTLYVDSLLWGNTVGYLSDELITALASQSTVNCVSGGTEQICSKSLKCSINSHPYHSVSSSPSAITLLLEVTQQKSINSEVHWTSKDFSFPKELLIAGTFYIRKTLLLLPWILSRTVYSSEEKLRWACSRTSRSAWPIGLVCAGDSSSVQVWSHLVRYLVPIVKSISIASRCLSHVIIGYDLLKIKLL